MPINTNFAMRKSTSGIRCRVAITRVDTERFDADCKYGSESPADPAQGRRRCCAGDTPGRMRRGRRADQLTPNSASATMPRLR